MSQSLNTLAFLFPGQGSQSVGMLSELAAQHPQVTETFREASDALGYDLWALIQDGPEEQLNSTLHTQPAMLAADVAVWRVWCRMVDVRPAIMGGHSLGEYSALVCAGALPFEQGLRLVVERARLMQSAVPSDVGAMAAILGLGDDQVTSVCEQASTTGEAVEAANFNAPGQVVIAGNREAVTRAIDLAKAAGAKRAVLLPVSVPSHCSLMKPAADGFIPVLESVALASPAITVLHNADVAAHESPEAIRSALARQLYGPVRWAESVRAMSAQGAGSFVECGPGRVLAGLNKRIVPDARTETIFDTNSLNKALGLLQ